MWIAHDQKLIDYNENRKTRDSYVKLSCQKIINFADRVLINWSTSVMTSNLEKENDQGIWNIFHPIEKLVW